MLRLGVALAVGLVACVAGVQSASAQMSTDPNCLWNTNTNEQIVGDAVDEGEPYYRSPSALNVYPTACGLFVTPNVFPGWSPSQVPIVVDLIAGRITDATTCAKIQLDARLWKISTVNTSDLSREQWIPGIVRSVQATWDGTRCAAPVKFTTAEQVTQREIDDEYRNMVQVRAWYRTSSGSVVRVPFMVRATRSSAKWTIPASAKTREVLGVKTWKIWFTRPRELSVPHVYSYRVPHDPDTEYGGDPAQGGQPLDAPGNDYAVPSRNYHIRDTLQAGEDNSAIVMQGFDAAGQHVGFISYRLNKGDTEQGTSSIAYGNRNDFGWWSDTITSDKPLRESFAHWSKHAAADMEASDTLVGYSCESQRFWALLGVMNCARATLGAGAVLASPGVGTLALSAAALDYVGSCLAGGVALEALLECRGLCAFRGDGSVATIQDSLTGDKSCQLPCSSGAAPVNFYDPGGPKCTLTCTDGKQCKLSLPSLCGNPCWVCPRCNLGNF